MPHEEILLYFQEPEILVSARRRVSDITGNPRKNIGCRPSNGLPWTETMHTRCCIFCCCRKSVLYVTPHVRERA